MWDERDQGEDYVYGTAPNDFLRDQIERIPAGRVLCLAEGEGRNAVFLAEQGFHVTAVDQSSVGLDKARRLAADATAHAVARQVPATYTLSAPFDMPTSTYLNNFEHNPTTPTFGRAAEFGALTAGATPTLPR